MDDKPHVSYNQAMGDEPGNVQLGQENKVKTWSNKMDFIMAAISSAIGLGNLWRFPYQCYRNGGGAFLVPFLIMIFIVGLPQVLADIALAQYSRSGCVRAYRAVPLLMGVGWLLILLSFELDSYYAVVISYTVFYTFASFTSKLPWASCDNWWNTENCVEANKSHINRPCLVSNGSALGEDCYINNTFAAQNITVTPAEEYFENYVLQLSPGITDIGLPRWPIILCVLFMGIIIFLTLLYGVKTWGKMAYVYALTPYVVMTALLIQSLFKEGSIDGMLYFLTPKWSELAKPRVWVDAGGQAFVSLGIAGGGLITVGSLNKFKNNCIFDSFVVTIADTLTSLLCGIVVFSILGLMAHEHDTSIDEVIGKGAGMPFVVYSASLAGLPSSSIWSAIFMIMMFTLGIGTMVSIVAMTHKVFMELLPVKLQRNRQIYILMLIGVLLLYFILGIVYTTNGGIYVLQMMDANANYIFLLVILIKCITISWIYGVDRIIGDIHVMTGHRLWKALGWDYKFISPLIILVVLIFNFTQYDPHLSYGSYIFPRWTVAIGWCLNVTALLVIPATAVYQIATFPKKIPLIMKLKELCKPALDWRNAENNNPEGTASHLI